MLPLCSRVGVGAPKPCGRGGLENHVEQGDAGSGDDAGYISGAVIPVGGGLGMGTTHSACSISTFSPNN